MIAGSGVTAAAVGVWNVWAIAWMAPVPRWMVSFVVEKLMPLERFSKTNWPLIVPDH